LGTLEQSLQALESGTYSGIGFMITPPLVFIDLDHSYDKTTGTITDSQAQEVVRDLNSYAEVSPSRRGLHILAYGRLLGKNIHTAIELYGQDRFTTITTEHLAGTPATIEQRQEAIASLYHRFAPPVTETTSQNVLWRTNHVGCENLLNELPPEALNEPLLQQLLAGDLSQFGNDQSRADFVLIMRLLDWTGDNISLTRQLFLQSPLGQREKAQRKTGSTTYVDMTINNVLKKRRRPPKRRP
jgi:putative DNA primase/helicase